MRFPRQVYMIKHNLTQRAYIGSSWQVEQRVRSHLWALRNGSHKVGDMQEDFDKYGEDYTVIVLDNCYNWKDHYKEYYWMTKYKTCVRGIGYNYKDNAKVQFRKFSELEKGA